MPPYLLEILKQSPLATVCIIAVIALARGYVVPGSHALDISTQCAADKTNLTNDRDRWQRLALRGSGLLQQRAQEIADIAPTAAAPNEKVQSVTIKPRPLPRQLRAEIEKPSVSTDAAAVEKRIDTASKVLESAPVPTKAKGQPE